MPYTSTCDNKDPYKKFKTHRIIIVCVVAVMAMNVAMRME